MAEVVWVIRGPVHSSEIPDWDIEEDGFGLRYGEGYVLDVISRDERGVLYPDQVIYEDFNDALHLVEWFTNQIIPYKWEDTV